jgi:energy-coupling factor transport system permease protein
VSRLAPVYRRRPTALHSARAGAGACFCLSFALLAVLYDNPLVLAAALAALMAAGAGAGVGRELRRAAVVGVPLALLIVVVNALVSQEGLTLLVRGGSFLGRRWDVTLEATVYGGIAGLRVLLLVLAFALFSAAVDPDELLRVLRRVSYRSALTASLCTRLVPVLAGDAARLGEAARCRPRPPGRVAVARATLAGALERAVELAAALEVRGYAGASRPRLAHAPWSRHDRRVAASAALISALAVGAKIAGIGGFEPYPSMSMEAGAAELGLGVALVLAAAVPFVGRAARLGVARG